MTPVGSHAIEVAADRLAHAARVRTPCAPVRDLIGRDDVGAAYLVQSRNVDSLVRSGRLIVGRKIGLTSKAVQAQLGVDQPDFGVLLDDFDVSDVGAIAFDRLLQPRIEAEIGFLLASDIEEPTTAERVQSSVSTVFASFEIVDSRISDWDISLADTIADNASSGLYVLGDRVDRTAVPNLADVTMTMTADGELVSEGRGSDCLGSPWEALAWLANTSIEYGSALRAGEVVLSGALGPMVSVTRGSTFHASIVGVGDVTATFTK
ncbi:2-keto-4-pentenoate hydratase [Rhodococcus sp. NBC_00297]|uniref:2-keto-4-pentenoate hydratase n=1 Tax=Rhodococcus sp. NBC_00297 TaxID=2976005 RepID=UPI002E2BE01B|nr:fumarylacetoacetate hydrolase family protein [Rhodococcus sp. NBC_00297]